MKQNNSVGRVAGIMNKKLGIAFAIMAVIGLTAVAGVGVATPASAQDCIGIVGNPNDMVKGFSICPPRGLPDQAPDFAPPLVLPTIP